MSTFRRRYRITVDGVEHDIVTSARDMAPVPMSDEGMAMADPKTVFATLYAACIRLGVPNIPHDFDKFLDLLDDMDELDGVPIGVTGDELSPTQRPA